MRLLASNIEREALSKQLKNFVTADMKEEARAALELFVLQKAVQAGGGIVIGETNDALIVQVNTATQHLLVMQYTYIEHIRRNMFNVLLLY